MGIQAKFRMSDVQRAISKAIEKEVYPEIIRQLGYVGEQSVALARERGSYTDQTGNLRASVGYVIAYNGKIVQESGFDPGAAQKTKKQRDGHTGSADGKQLAYELAGKSRGFVLVVTAGMKYGIYVEKRQYDVLTFTEANARILANDLLGDIFGAA